MPPRARRHDEASLRGAWQAQLEALADAGSPVVGECAGGLVEALSGAAPLRVTTTAVDALARLDDRAERATATAADLAQARDALAADRKSVV